MTTWIEDYNQAMAERKQQRPTLWGGWKLRKGTYELVYPYPDNRGDRYPIDLERFTSSAQVLDMIAQVAGKTWATDACLAGLVRALDDILMLQSNLCGSGVGKPLTTAQIRKLVKQS